VPAPVSEHEIESLTRRIGEELFERMRGGGPWIVQPAWWQGRLLRLFMHEEQLKGRALRLIAELPRLGHDPRAIAQRLRAHFSANGAVQADGGSNAEVAAPMTPAPRDAGEPATPNGALGELSGGGRGGLTRLIERLVQFERDDSLRARLLARLAWAAAHSMARRFIAGETVAEAEQALLRLRRRRLAFTLDVLGETTSSQREADAAHQTYLHLIRELPKKAAAWPPVPQIDYQSRAGHGPVESIPRVNISVKLTSLHAGLDGGDPAEHARIVKERLRPLLRAAMAGGVHLHIDMEHYAIKDLTLAVCRDLFAEPEFRDYAHFGLVLQAYLRDADRDAAEIVEYARRRGTPLGIRLVKGAYWDTEVALAGQRGTPCPVWQQKWETDACYERLSRLLLHNHRYTRVAFASHNVRSLAHAIALRRLWDVPGPAFELQMLYGMGDEIQSAAVALGERCRVYTPYGKLLAGMAYLTRRLLENTANESFLRHAAEQDVPIERLLANPREVGARAGWHGLVEPGRAPTGPATASLRQTVPRGESHQASTGVHA